MGRCGRMDGTRRNSVGNQKVKHHKHRNIRRNCSVVWTWKDPFYTSKYKHHGLFFPSEHFLESMLTKSLSRCECTILMLC